MIFFKNRWVKFTFWGILYLLWVIWLGNYWWLFGLPVIFDLYITKKVKWAFWRRKEKKGNIWDTILDWLDAIIFAVVAAMVIKIFWFEAFTIPSSSMEKTLYTGDYLFVTKVAYGPKIPQTPLSFPLVHNTMPISGRESYSTLIQNKYRRLKGLSKIKREDIIVFSFPHGDTVLKQAPQADYYQLVRLNNNNRNAVISMLGPIIVRPKDKKDNYVKRCVALPGDTLKIIDGVVYINGNKEGEHPYLQSSYKVVLKENRPINPKIFDEFNVNVEEIVYDSSLPGYSDIPLTKDDAKRLSNMNFIASIDENIDVYPPDYPESPALIFPFTTEFEWTKDNYGPIWIPSKGSTIQINKSNLPLYERIITSYEGNVLEVRGDEIIINGENVSSYTFKQDYFWMMGDNRHNSLDSRYWGFVPEDHIVGTPYLIWFSKDKYRGIRWNRIFKRVRNS